MKKACGFYLMADGVSVMAYLQWHTCHFFQPVICAAGTPGWITDTIIAIPRAILRAVYEFRIAWPQKTRHGGWDGFLPEQ